MDGLAFIAEVYSEDTGGGFECDVLTLKDGTVLVIGEESVVLYSDMDAWENIAAAGQVGTIFRPVKVMED